jgi:hypothetical protein
MKGENITLNIINIVKLNMMTDLLAEVGLLNK